MTGQTCMAAGCLKPPSTRGYCERCYRYRLHTGRYGYRDATAAREHVLALRGLGWTFVQISEATQVSAWVACNLASGRTRRVLADSEAAILAVPLEPVASQRGVNGIGTYRRVEALQWMGWPLADIGRRVGLKPYTLCTLRSRGEPVSFRVARAVAVVFDELAHLPGPSKQTATKARRRGYAPPLAWDDDTIDDPDALPQVDVRGETIDEVAIQRAMSGQLTSPLTSAERQEAARRMAAAGTTRSQIAKRLRCSDHTVLKLLEAS
jgi:hypothetical protein